MASLIEQVEQLIVEAGPNLEPVESIVRVDDEPKWAVFWGEDLQIDLHCVEDQNRLSLSARVGAPEEDYRTRLYEQLLLYNSLTEETGGVQMSLEEPGGQIRIRFDLYGAELDLASVQNLIENFAEKAHHWRDHIQNGEVLSGEEGKAGRDDLLSGPDEAGIRV